MTLLQVGGVVALLVTIVFAVVMVRMERDREARKLESVRRRLRERARRINSGE